MKVRVNDLSWRAIAKDEEEADRVNEYFHMHYDSNGRKKIRRIQVAKNQKLNGK